MESKVFMIIGKSFSGKDTFLNDILDHKEFCEKNNLVKLVRYTTRDQRPNEIEGKDYHFISEKQFHDKFNYDPIKCIHDESAVVSVYFSIFGKLYYGTDLSELEPDKNYITVGDLESVESYKKILGNRLCIIFLSPPDWVLFDRFSKRDDNSNYINLKYQEIQRRYLDDLKKFSINMNSILCQSNCIISVERNCCLHELKDYINEFINTKWNKLGILITSNSNAILNMNYKCLEEFTACTDVTNGEIIICNGNITIQTTDESYTVNNDKSLLAIID